MPDLPLQARRRDHKGIYRRVPVLIKEGPPEENPWGIRIRQGLYHMTIDSQQGHLRPRQEHPFPSPSCCYEGKMFYQYDAHFSVFAPALQRYVEVSSANKGTCESNPSM